MTDMKQGGRHKDFYKHASVTRLSGKPVYKLSLFNYQKALLKAEFRMSSQNNWYGCRIAGESHPGL